MEVKPGCKTTQIAITDGWREVQLAWCVQLGAPICYGILMPGEHFRSGVPVVKVKDIINGKIQESGLLYTHPSIDNAYKRSKLNQRDVLITIRGTTGRVALVSASLDGANITQDTARVRIMDEIDAQFIYYAMQSEPVQQQVALHTIGQAVKGINIRDVKELVLALPDSISEQRAIAAALSDVDALLDGLDRLIAKKRDLKQAAMQQLLTGQTRLPGFSGAWEVRRLGSVMRFQVGFPFSSAYFNEKEQGIRLVKNRDLKSDDQIFHYAGRFDPAYLVNDGDVLVGMDGDFLPCLWTKGSALLNQRVGRVVPLSGLHLVFSFYFLLKPLKEIEIATASTTVKHLSHSDVENIEKPLPSLTEQTAIAAILSDMDAEIAALEARRDKTRALKQGMMQELLTGRIRLV